MTRDRTGAGGADPGRTDVVARLTWQVPDPATFADELSERLGIHALPGHGPSPTMLVPLDGSVLEIVPWQHEAPGDEPQPAGRLVLEPIEPGRAPWGGPPAEASLTPAGPPAPRRSDAGMVLAGIGWATVDLARAARELGPWLVEAPIPGVGGATPGRDRDDPHLGARTLVRATNGLPGEVLVLAEPTTEGRLAASLARHGEGPVALYLRPGVGLDAWVVAARTRNVMVSTRREGPLGRQVLVGSAAGAVGRTMVAHAAGAGATGGTRTAKASGRPPSAAMVGPHLIVVSGRNPSSREASDGNIRA